MFISLGDQVDPTIEWQIFQIDQGRIVGAKVIQRDPDAQDVECVEHTEVASGQSALTASIQTISNSLSGCYCRNAHKAP